ncbi:MAG: alpha/beta fold hydrolase [Actinomycetia bacterium]|nr:alpha/beta fold hydrolase [Actinomycetes bacterium]
MRRAFPTLLVLVALAVFTSACSDDGLTAEVSEPRDSSTPTTTANPTDADSDDGDTGRETGGGDTNLSDLGWSDCGGFECVKVSVPVAYENGPDEAGNDFLSIAVARQLATGDESDYLGVLMVNPGGPGVSAIEFLRLAADGYLPEQLSQFFDLVAFDPRGVGDSEPDFACGLAGDHIVIANAIGDEVDTPEDEALAELAVERCTESMGAAAGLLHTEYVARDMDRVREALGVEQITYLGFSYGSAIGTWYATLFPERVRAMVLDGADNPVDPSQTRAQRVDNAMEETAPLEDKLRSALEACDDRSCPIYNGGDPVAYYYEAATKLHLVDEELQDAPFAGALGVITTLYSEETWPLLWDGLSDLNEFDDPTLFSDLALFQLDDPSQPSFTAHVNCLDSWVIDSHVDRYDRVEDLNVMTDRVAAELPLLSALDLTGFDVCPYFDTIAPAALDRPLDGSDVPIIVIGNHGDPVTPFAESEQLATETLSNGLLVEVNHPEHTVYPNNECVNDIVDRVLIDGVTPTSDRVGC